MSATSRRPGDTACSAGHARLASALVHEAGNLLAAIRLSAHLSQSEGAAERDERARDVEELATWCGALLAHVRTLVAEDAVERTRMAPADVLMGIERVLEDRARGRVRLLAESAELPEVRVDPEALHHALVSLVLGGLEASRPRGRVQVSARAEGARVLFVIEDHGHPCDAEELERPVPRGGRELAARVADVVLRGDRGRVDVCSDAEGTRIVVSLPTARERGGRAGLSDVVSP